MTGSSALFPRRGDLVTASWALFSRREDPTTGVNGALRSATMCRAGMTADQHGSGYRIITKIGEADSRVEPKTVFGTTARAASTAHPRLERCGVEDATIPCTKSRISVAR
jgi:hypothetical protein